MDGYYAQVRLGIGKAILSYKRRADLRAKAFFPSLLAKRRAERRRRRRLIRAARGFYTLECEDAESVRHQLDKVLKIPQKIRKYPWQELESLSSSEAVVPSGHASRDTKIKARKLSAENWRCQNAGTSEGHHAGDNTLTAAKLRAMIEREFRVGKKRKNAMPEEGRTSDQRSALHGSIEYEFAIGRKYRKTSYHNRLQLRPKDTHITSARLHSAIERRLESYNQGDISQLFGRSQDHRRITEDVEISVGKLDTTNEIHELAAEISSQILKERMQGFCNEKKQPSSSSSSTNPQHGKSSEHADVSEAGSDCSCSSESFLLVTDDDEDIRMLYDLINGLDGISNERPSDKPPKRLQQADQAIRSSGLPSDRKEECITDVQSIGDRVSLRIGRRMSRKNTSETSSDQSGPSEGFLLIADDDGEIKTLYDLITGFDDIDGKQSNENSLNSVQQATPATQPSKLFSYVKKDRRKPTKPVAECTPVRNSRWASGKMAQKQDRGREKRRNSREETDVERHEFNRKKWRCSAPEKRKRTQYTAGRRYKRTREQRNSAHLICAANTLLHTVPLNGVQPSPAGKHLDKMCSQLEKCREMRAYDKERPSKMMPVKSKPGSLVKREKVEPEQDTTEDVIIILSDSDDETPVRKQLNYRIERQKVKTVVPEIIEISDSEDENQPHEPSSAELQPKFQGLLQNTVSLSHEMTTDCDVMPVASTEYPLTNTENPYDENNFCSPTSAAVARTVQDSAKTHHRRKQRSPKRAGSQPILPFHRTLADSYKRLKTLGDSSAKDGNQSVSGLESLPTQTPQTFCTLEGVKNDAQLCSSTEQAGKYDFHENECEIIVEGALDYYGHGDWAAEPKCHHE